jgi:hypothetical protein
MVVVQYDILNFCHHYPLAPVTSSNHYFLKEIANINARESVLLNLMLFNETVIYFCQ